MCGRFSQFSLKKVLEKFGIEETSFEFLPNYNCSPGQKAFVIVGDKGRNNLVLMNWGIRFLRAMSSQTLINIRFETLKEKRSFDHMLEYGRCIVPVNGFYEWKKEKGQNIPYYCTPYTDDFMLLAGLYRKDNVMDDVGVFSFSIVTKPSDDSMKSLHHRMPLILNESNYSLWLYEKWIRKELFLSNFSSVVSELKFYRVSPLVNNPKNNLPDCILPI